MNSGGLPHQTKYEHLADILRSRLRSQPEGSRLPSVRSLMKRFQISQHTVMSALQILESERLISRRNGSGVYASQASRPVTVCFCRPQDVNPLHDRQEKSLRQACRTRGWGLVVARFEALEVHFLDDDISADAYVLLPEVVTFRSPLIGRLAARNNPVVIFGRDTSSAQLDFVTGDDLPVVREFVSGLVQRGHRRIAYLECEPPFHEVQKRTECFRETCAMLGLKDCPVLDVQVRYGSDSIKLSEQFLQRHLAGLGSGRLPFTALLTGSASGSIPAFRVFYDAGIRIPADLSLCCMGSDPRAVYTTPPLSNAACDQGELAEAAVQILEKRLAGDRTPLLGETLPYRAVWRGSTGSPAKRTGRTQKKPPVASRKA